jgi:Acetyltransferases, including N-acetylases of ribosomal proteins
VRGKQEVGCLISEVRGLLIMQVIFETERLVIRRYVKADEENFFRLNSDPEVMRYIRAPKSRSACNVFLLQMIAFYEQHPLMGRWAMLLKTTGEFIGSFAIIPVENRPEIQLGYALFKEYWGRGYATELVQAGLQYAFDVMKLPGIVAITESANQASQKVLLKCGFTQRAPIVEQGRELCFFDCQNPYVVETQRLLIFPLNQSQLSLYLEAANKLEKALDLKPSGRSVAPQVKESVLRHTLPAIRAAAGNHYLFITFWLVVYKPTRAIVAELGFKGPPDHTGTVEIGYGTMPSMQGRGIMSEAVGGMLQWAARQPDIQYVLAETHRTNTASIRVVQKNGFEPLPSKGDMLWWRFKTRDARPYNYEG